MNYIRKLYKQDYRGFESLPHRRENVIEKYSVKSQRPLLKKYKVFSGRLWRNVYILWVEL